MADFCAKCSERVFGKDMGDLFGLCDSTEMIQVMCEGCGLIWVDSRGRKVDLEENVNMSSRYYGEFEFE